MDDTLAKNQREALERLIRQRIAAVSTDIAVHAERSAPVAPDNAIGRLSRLDALGSRAVDAETLRRSRETLQRLERALKGLHDPEFGVCHECEEPIPFARLQAVPETTLCVRCAAELTG